MSIKNIDSRIKSNQFYDQQDRLWHIINSFKDEGEYVITFKTWSKRKQAWYLKSEYLDLFLIGFDYGYKWKQ